MLISQDRRSGSWCASEAGATLIEIFVTLAIVLIGTLLAIPVYQGWTAKADLRQAVTEVNGTLALARVAAMNRNTGVTVTVVTVGGRVQIQAVGVTPPTLMRTSITAFTGGPVRFSSLGVRLLPGGTANELITLTNSQGLTYSVIVTPGGKINWCPQATCP